MHGPPCSYKLSVESYNNYNFISGNSELFVLSPERLKNKFLYADHFNKIDILNRKLSSVAVPIKYKEVPREVEVGKEIKQYGPSSSTQTISPPSTSGATPEGNIYFVTPEKHEPTISTASLESGTSNSFRDIAQHLSMMPSPSESRGEKRRREVEDHIETPRKKKMKDY